MSQQSEYKKIYIQESDELLQQMNKSLLVLEKEPRNSEVLNAIFRSAHTLKSMASSMGYHRISDLAHRMEGLLEQLRSGASETTPGIVDILFKAFDALESMTLSVQEEKEIKKDIASLIAAFDSFIIKVPKTKEEKVEGGLSLSVFDKRTLIRVKKEGFRCFNIEIALDKACVLKGVRVFMVFRNLHEIGEVIKSYPDSQALEEEKFGLNFSCIFITKESEKAVKKKVLEILDVSRVKVEEVAISKLWEDEVAEDETPASFQTGAGETPGPIVAGEGLRKIQSVRVDIRRLDKLVNLAEELAINKLRLIAVGQRTPDIELKSVIEELNRLTEELQSEVMQARLVPVSQIFDRFPRLVRDLAKDEGKLIKLDVTGGDIELDRTVLDEIGDPLIHLLRNAIDHGIEMPQERKSAGKNEEGRIMLMARREKSHIFIEVEDDGKGMDAQEIKKVALKRGVATREALDIMTDEEILLLTANPGFSTKEEVTEVSGRGVGLDVAKQKTESLGGGIYIETKVGKGTKISLRLPITTAVVQALLVDSMAKTFALPVVSIIEIVAVKPADIKTIEGKEAIMHRDRVLPIVRLERLFELSAVSYQLSAEDEIKAESRKLKAESNHLNIVIVESGRIEFGIVVEKLIGQHDIVIKQLTKELRGVRGFAGATILGDGSVALVLDVATLI